MTVVLESLPSLAMPIGAGGTIAFIAGYAARKIMKVLIVLAGVGIIEVIWLQSKGILAVDYDKLNAFAQNTTQTIMNAAATGNNHAVGNAGNSLHCFFHVSSNARRGSFVEEVVCFIFFLR
jgi:uncharacterized membrane protein (Fun14 family)